MVLPAPPPANAHAPVEGRWIQRIVRQLALTDRGILLLVDRGQPWRLEALLRRLVEVYGDVEVYTEASAMATVPIGSTVVLVPNAKDAEAMNMARALFARHELRVVVFCERSVSEILRRDAPDFFDWISLVVECPETHPPHIVAAINMAMSLNAPAIAWNSDAPDAMRTMQMIFDDVLHVRQFLDVDLNRPFESIIKDISLAKGTWLRASVDRPLLLWRFRWALSVAGRFDPSVVVIAPEQMRIAAYEAGFFPVHAATLSMAEARRRLVATGATFPGRLAAWLRCEPDAIDLAVKLLAAGEDEAPFECAVKESRNPCAYMARLAMERGIVIKNSAIIRLCAKVEEAESNVVPALTWSFEPQWAPPGHMALRAFELGDDNAGEYFVKRWLRREVRHDGPMRERLAQWVDIERIYQEIFSAPAAIPIDIDTTLSAADPEQWERRILLDQLGAMLDPDDQLLLKRYLADLDFADIAVEMGTRTHLVREQFEHIVEELRSLMDER